MQNSGFVYQMISAEGNLSLDWFKYALFQLFLPVPKGTPYLSFTVLGLVKKATFFISNFPDEHGHISELKCTRQARGICVA